MNNDKVITHTRRGSLIQLIKEKLNQDYNSISELFSLEIVSMTFVGRNLNNIA